MRISLGALARTHKGTVSLGHVLNLPRAFAFHALKASPSKTPVLVEFRAPFTSTSTDEAEDRLNQLVQTLRNMHTSSTNDEPSKTTPTNYVNFSILKCLGWIRPDTERLGLLFECPQVSQQRPLSLAERIAIDRNLKKSIPALGIRFDIAYGLAKVIADLVTIGWVHKEIRSANLLFFDSKAPRHFFLTGFTYSRANHFAQDASALPEQNMSHRYYQPQFYLDQMALLERGIPGNEKITSAVDIYALGVIMIELAFWDRAEELQKELYAGFKETGWERYLDGLPSRMGEIYAGVVRNCIKLGDWVEDEDKEREFIAGVLQELGRLKA
jgi:hypothetical protein